jgi:hypothetical protein
VKYGAGEHDMTVQHEAGRKTDQKGNNESCDIWFERDEPEVQNLLLQNVIISDEKNENVQNGVESPAGCVAKRL